MEHPNGQIGSSLPARQEVAPWLAVRRYFRTAKCRRGGKLHQAEREIMTGIGPVAVRQPRVRDREAIGGERIRFSPSILPPYARRTKSLEVLIPILYLKGISTGDFEGGVGRLARQGRRRTVSLDHRDPDRPSSIVRPDRRASRARESALSEG
jgi:hypothetical protein